MSNFLMLVSCDVDQQMQRKTLYTLCLVILPCREKTNPPAHNITVSEGKWQAVTTLHQQCNVSRCGTHHASHLGGREWFRRNNHVVQS